MLDFMCALLLWTAMWAAMITVYLRAKGMSLLDKALLTGALFIFLYILPMVLIASVASAQVSCFAYGSNMLSCDGPNLSNRTITDLGQGRGIITDEKGNIEPYMVLPSTPQRQHAPTVKPVPSLPLLDRFDRGESLLPSWRDEPMGWDRD
jgi:hypothetical protein